MFLKATNIGITSINAGGPVAQYCDALGLVAEPMPRVRKVQYFLPELQKKKTLSHRTVEFCTR